MSESGDFEPGIWAGHNFDDARATYDVHVGRSYDDAKVKSISVDDLVPPKLTTDSEYPLVIVCDVTGSMGEWPATIFEKLGYFDLECKEYLGDNMQVSFAAIGDAHSDSYPLQVNRFCNGTDLLDSLKKLVIEGKGGSNYHESYDLAATYYFENVDMPNAIHKPIMIFIGDEQLYDTINKEATENWCRVTVKNRQTVAEVIEKLKTKYSVYLIRKPYGSGYTGSGDKVSPIDEQVHTQWTQFLGNDHVAILPQAARVVDVIFGILAKETGRIGYFKDEITGRQRADQVDTVMKSLNTIHKLPHKTLKQLPGGEGASITRRKNGSGGENSISLLA